MAWLLSWHGVPLGQAAETDEAFAFTRTGGTPGERFPSRASVAEPLAEAAIEVQVLVAAVREPRFAASVGEPLLVTAVIDESGGEF